MLASIAIIDTLTDYTDGFSIKWPNDIWVDDRKICGILIENILDGKHISESIVGIGLNVNEKDWPEELPNPVSMRELSGKEYSLQEELGILHKEICRRYLQSGSIDGRINLKSEFEKLMFKLREEP